MSKTHLRCIYWPEKTKACKNRSGEWCLLSSVECNHIEEYAREHDGGGV